MSKVYIVNMLCPDDSDDNTQICGVYNTAQKAQEAILEMEEEGLEADVEIWDVA